MEDSSAHRWAMAAAIARDQHGRITTHQLNGCGITTSSIEKAVASGRLHRVHVGVYAIGHRAPSRLADWIAAALACGPGSGISHRSGSTLWRIRDGEFSRIDVTNATGNGRTRPGIRVHQAQLLPVEWTRHRDVPVTSPSRTMVDLAHELGESDAIAWALRQLQYRRLYNLPLLELSLSRRPNRALRELLDDLAPTRSPLEVEFLSRVVRRHGLPAPGCQVKLEGFTVDFFWPEARLVVEVDGRNHALPAMQQADAIRDNRLLLAEYVVLRYTKADITRRHKQVADQILAVLRR